MIIAPFHKGFSVRVIKNALRKAKGEVLSVGFGDSPADRYLLSEVNHPFWVTGPEDLNRKVLDFFKEA